MAEQFNFDALEKAIASLEEGLREYAQYPQLTTSRDGVILRFEVATDIAQQFMRRVLMAVFHLDQASVYKNTAREAARMGLIADAALWIGYVNARNATSHTYDSEQAERVFATIPAFVADVRTLLENLKHAVA